MLVEGPICFVAVVSGPNGIQPALCHDSNPDKSLCDSIIFWQHAVAVYNELSVSFGGTVREIHLHQAHGIERSQ